VSRCIKYAPSLHIVIKNWITLLPCTAAIRSHDKLGPPDFANCELLHTLFQNFDSTTEVKCVTVQFAKPMRIIPSVHYATTLTIYNLLYRFHLLSIVLSF
jgi:hypothetical protein